MQTSDASTMVVMRTMLEGNFAQLRMRLASLLASGHIPLVFLDLDDTSNRHFGMLIEAQVVAAMRELDAAGVVLGLNTGADISWAGERILCETDRHFIFPFMVLATGGQIYVWVESLQAYARLPLPAHSKGQAMRALAEFLDRPLDQFAYIADFPGAGDQQEGIDDSVLREPVGLVINVGGLRPPEELICSYETTLVLHPPQREQRIGCGYEATALYLTCLTEAIVVAGSAERAQALRADLLRQVEQRVTRLLGVPVDPDVSDPHTFQLWTFERPVPEVPRGQPIRIRTQAHGLVHAGVTATGADGRWQRIYDVPLREDAPGRWEATLLDGEVNEFTFIWFDPTRSGRVKWEGRNYQVRRTP
jgi:hypothetical protein